jgi:hypothetical protein
VSISRSISKGKEQVEHVRTYIHAHIGTLTPNHCPSDPSLDFIYHGSICCMEGSASVQVRNTRISGTLAGRETKTKLKKKERERERGLFWPRSAYITGCTEDVGIAWTLHVEALAARERKKGRGRADKSTTTETRCHRRCTRTTSAEYCRHAAQSGRIPPDWECCPEHTSEQGWAATCTG